jgi:hypothetical protein
LIVNERVIVVAGSEERLTHLGALDGLLGGGVRGGRAEG